MFILNRIIPIVSALLILGLLEIINFNPPTVYVFGIGLLVVAFFTIFLATGRRLQSGDFWHLLISPLILLASTLLFFLLLEKLWARQVFIAVIGFVYWLYIKNVYAYARETKDYQPYALQNISSYINLISVICFYIVIFAVKILFYYKAITLSILVFIVSFLLIDQTIWVNKVSGVRERLLFSLILSMILVEVFLALLFLPTNFFVNGFVLAAIFYCLVNISRYYLVQRLDRQVIQRYLFISLSVVILILATAQWI